MLKIKLIPQWVIILASSICIFSCSNISLADESTTQVGRYLAAPNIPTASQADLLSQTFQVRFPQSVKTIGDAVRYLLNFSGYSLVDNSKLTPEAKNLMALPLPQAHRALGPLSLEQGLQTLVGYPFGLMVDPVHRLISFRVLQPYQALYRKSVF